MQAGRQPLIRARLLPEYSLPRHCVGIVKDANGNALGADDLWSFTTADNSFTDTTVADFSAGTTDPNTYVSQIGDGEVILGPTSGTEFSGSSLPADWASSIWNSGGGAIVSGGQLTVDGAFASTTSMFGPGRSLEFSATFGPAQFEHAGFAVDLNNVGLWAIFSTKDTTTDLYARTNNNGNLTDTPIPGSWLDRRTVIGLIGIRQVSSIPSTELSCIRTLSRSPTICVPWSVNSIQAAAVSRSIGCI